ncbi:MAG: EAL domain-containing response regulator [Oceanococcus sp.]
MSYGRLQALVADDDPISRGIVAEQLLSLGVGSVRSASSGNAALRQLKEHPEINLLITDLKMPDMDGIALLRELESLSPRLGVIIMSALGNKILRAAETIGGGHKLDVLGIAEKPIRRKYLEQLLAKAPQKFTQSPSSASNIRSANIVNPQDITDALENDQHLIVVQPEIDAISGLFVGLEVLSRWSHPQLSLHSPGDVIETAEAAGLMSALLRSTMRKAGKAWQRWAHDGLSPTISINLSNQNLADADLPEWLQEECRRHRLSPENVILEITETAVPSSATVNLEVAFRLGLSGFRLSIDDFGTGHSNLRQLQDMPFHQLKIDKSFVDQIEDSFEARTIIESSLQLAHNLGLTTVAEGVETLGQLNALRDMGCTLIQGYLLARPMPPENLAAWAKQHANRVQSLRARAV